MDRILRKTLAELTEEDITYCNEHWGEYTNTRNNHLKNYYLAVLRDERNQSEVRWDDGTNYPVLGKLFHSNSVSTSLDFIRQGHLYSRRHGYEAATEQTQQRSDELDRELGIDNDIFFDACDIPHYAGSHTSAYGPVMFVLDPDILSDDDVAIRITKFNPINIDDEQRTTVHYGDLFYKNTQELREAMRYSGARFMQDYGHHVTVVNKETLAFGQHLKMICIERHPSGNGQEIGLKEIIERELRNEGMNDVRVVIRPEVPEEMYIYANSIEELWAFPG